MKVADRQDYLFPQGKIQNSVIVKLFNDVN